MQLKSRVNDPIKGSIAFTEQKGTSPPTTSYTGFYINSSGNKKEIKKSGNSGNFTFQFYIECNEEFYFSYK